MVSATAILISGVNARYISIADRVRKLAQEYRGDGVSAERRKNIERQMIRFHFRLHLVSWAARVLYASVACFVAIALVISMSVWSSLLEGATLPMFLFGLSLEGIAIALQLLELQVSNSTIHIESEDILRRAREPER